MSTISVTLGVIFAKKGIFTAALTQRQMLRTKSGLWRDGESTDQLHTPREQRVIVVIVVIVVIMVIEVIVVIVLI